MKEGIAVIKSAENESSSDSDRKRQHISSKSKRIVS